MDQSLSLVSAQVQFMVSLLYFRPCQSRNLPCKVNFTPPPFVSHLRLLPPSDVLAMDAGRPRLVSLTTVVEIQEDRLALVHIPLDLYPYFLYPIMQVLFHEVPPLHENSENGENSTSVHAQPAFLNLSITPVECSIMCPRHLANQYFAPLVDRFVKANTTSQSRLSISHEDFIAMQVYGEGLEAGQRVLELTSPLAMAGMYVSFAFLPDYTATNNPTVPFSSSRPTSPITSLFLFAAKLR